MRSTADMSQTSRRESPDTGRSRSIWNSGLDTVGTQGSSHRARKPTAKCMDHMRGDGGTLVVGLAFGLSRGRESLAEGFGARALEPRCRESTSLAWSCSPIRSTSAPSCLPNRSLADAQAQDWRQLPNTGAQLQAQDGRQLSNTGA